MNFIGLEIQTYFQNFYEIFTVFLSNLLFIPRKAGYCNHLRVSVCLFVCLLAGFLKNDWSDFDEVW